MRFTSTFASIAAIVATAAAAPAPAAAASQYGSWALDYSYTSAANGYKNEVFTATYSVDGSTAKQTFTDLENQQTTVSDPQSFSASWDGTSEFFPLSSSFFFTHAFPNRSRHSSEHR